MLALHELCMLSAFVHTVSDGCLVDSETSEDLGPGVLLHGAAITLAMNVLINSTNLALFGNAQLQQHLHVSDNDRHACCDTANLLAQQQQATRSFF